MDVCVNVSASKATFRVTGKMIVQTAPDLEAAIGRTPPEACDIDVDLAGVDYVSSAGLRVIAAAGRTAERRGGVLRLLHPRSNVRDMFEMTGMADKYAIVD